MFNYKFVFFIFLFFISNLYSKEIKGRVTDISGKPIPFAEVRLQNTPYQTNTNRQGEFKIDIFTPIKSKYITASKNGFIIGGTAFKETKQEYTIKLKKLPMSDNKEYKFTPSLKSSITTESISKQEKICQNCHTRIVSEWKKDKHSKSAKNKNFLSVFKKGFKHDFPNSKGNCNNCHTPLKTLNTNSLNDHLDFTPLEKEGINCDFCHKIKDVDTKKNNLTGTQRLDLLRPHGKSELLFGSMNDVFPRNDAYLKIYEQSKFCASCHHGSFWGELVYSEFEEWRVSPYPKEGKSCQSCHMKQSKKADYIADKDKGGFLRDHKEIHSHHMKDTDDIDFIKDALDINISHKIEQNRLCLNISVTNTGAGHHIPTGSPFRHMILNIKGINGKNKNIPQISNHTIPSWAHIKGVGKVFAKIYRPAKLYTNKGVKFEHSYPELFWRPIHLEYDTRIKAKTTDTTQFIFDIKNSKKAIFDIKLTYLNFFDSTIKDMDLDKKVLELYKKRVVIGAE